MQINHLLPVFVNIIRAQFSPSFKAALNNTPRARKKIKLQKMSSNQLSKYFIKKTNELIETYRRIVEYCNNEHNMIVKIYASDPRELNEKLKELNEKIHAIMNEFLSISNEIIPLIIDETARKIEKEKNPEKQEKIIQSTTHNFDQVNAKLSYIHNELNGFCSINHNFYLPSPIGPYAFNPRSYSTCNTPQKSVRIE